MKKKVQAYRWTSSTARVRALELENRQLRASLAGAQKKLTDPERELPPHCSKCQRTTCVCAELKRTQSRTIRKIKYTAIAHD